MDIDEEGTTRAVTNDELDDIQEYFTKKESRTYLMNLKKHDDEPDARVLLVKNGIKWIGANKEKLYEEISAIDKSHMVRKSLCWSYCATNLKRLPELGKIQQGIDCMANQLGMPHLTGLLAEASVYENDFSGERYRGDDHGNSPVIGCNLGNDQFICFRSFFRHEMYGNEIKIKLEHGDMYFLSEEAVGIGWRKTNTMAFRRRLGTDKFLASDNKRLESLFQRKRDRIIQAKRMEEQKLDDYITQMYEHIHKKARF